MELHARAPHGFITASRLAFASCFLPAPELPLPLQLLMVSMLGSQPFTWGLRLQEQGQGEPPVHTGALEFNSERAPGPEK